MTTIPHRIAAGLFGLVALFGTGYVMFADVIAGGPFTIEHAQAAGILALTLGAGHFCLPMLAARRLVTGAGLALVFVAGTVLVVAGSAGRTTEAAKVKGATAQATAQERRQLETDIKQARADHTEAKRAEKAECVTVGKQCDAKTRRADAAWSHVQLLEARLRHVEPEREAHASSKAVAKVIAALPFVMATETAIAASLAVVLPYLTAVGFELATLAFFGVAFGARKGHPVTFRSAFPVTVTRTGQNPVNIGLGDHPGDHPRRSPAKLFPRSPERSPAPSPVKVISGPNSTPGDRVHEFIADRLVIGGDAEITSTQLWDVYAGWDANATEASRKRLGAALRSRGVTRRKSHGKVIYSGVDVVA